MCYGIQKSVRGGPAPTRSVQSCRSHQAVFFTGLFTFNYQDKGSDNPTSHLLNPMVTDAR